MSSLDAANKTADSILQQVENLKSIVKKLTSENEELKKRIKELENGVGSSSPSSQFEINVGESERKVPKKADGNIPAPTDSPAAAPSKTNSSGVVKDKPALGPESIDYTNLDDLLANDALVNTVYHKLKPMGQLKYRLLAMQMGISIDRCKGAIDKLVNVGAVSIDEKEVVKIQK